MCFIIFNYYTSFAWFVLISFTRTHELCTLSEPNSSFTIRNFFLKQWYYFSGFDSLRHQYFTVNKRTRTSFQTNMLNNLTPHIEITRVWHPFTSLKPLLNSSSSFKRPSFLRYPNLLPKTFFLLQKSQKTLYKYQLKFSAIFARFSLKHILQVNILCCWHTSIQNIPRSYNMKVSS